MMMVGTSSPETLQKLSKCLVAVVGLAARAATSGAPRASLSDGPRRHSRDVIAPREPQSLGHVNDDACWAAETNTAVRVIRVDVAPGTRAVTPWRRWPDARRWKDAACSLFTPKRLRRGGSVPKPVLWANQSAWREVVTDKLNWLSSGDARHCTDAARTASSPPAEAMPTTDATTRGIAMRRRSSSLVAMTREALLLTTLGVLTLSFVQSDSTPSEPSCVR